MYAHNQHIGKSNNLGLCVLENKGPKQISKIGYGDLCLRNRLWSPMPEESAMVTYA